MGVSIRGFLCLLSTLNDLNLSFDQLNEIQTILSGDAFSPDVIFSCHVVCTTRRKVRRCYVRCNGALIWWTKDRAVNMLQCAMTTNKSWESFEDGSSSRCIVAALYDERNVCVRQRSALSIHLVLSTYLSDILQNSMASGPAFGISVLRGRHSRVTPRLRFQRFQQAKQRQYSRRSCRMRMSDVWKSSADCIAGSASCGVGDWLLYVEPKQALMRQVQTCRSPNKRDDSPLYSLESTPNHSAVLSPSTCHIYLYVLCARPWSIPKSFNMHHPYSSQPSVLYPSISTP